MHRNRRLRSVLAACVVALALGVTAAPASAGYYDYQLTLPANSWYSRFVDHDYSRLHGYTAGVQENICLARSSGQAFCAFYVVDHVYSGSCNPSACVSWYYNYKPYDAVIQAHDEWR